jgi:hypothetical protein
VVVPYSAVAGALVMVGGKEKGPEVVRSLLATESQSPADAGNWLPK